VTRRALIALVAASFAAPAHAAEQANIVAEVVSPILASGERTDPALLLSPRERTGGTPLARADLARLLLCSLLGASRDRPLPLSRHPDLGYLFMLLGNRWSPQSWL